MKSYNFLKLSLGEFLRILQKKTAENANKMKEIFDYTTSIKKSEPDSEERKIKLKNALLLNNELISINRKYIDLHNLILDIVNDLASDDDSNTYSIEENEHEISNPSEISSHTEEIHIESDENVDENSEYAELELNKNNPLFKNKEYTDKLMQKYIELEEYEKCNMLQKLISSNHQ